MSKKPKWHEGVGSIRQALQVARHFRFLPTMEDLQRWGGMSRPTAYRWRKAMQDAGWQEPGEASQ